MLSVISDAVRVATTSDSVLERETGIGPASSAWKADALPLSYSRIGQWTTKLIAQYSSVKRNSSKKYEACPAINKNDMYEFT